MNKENIPPSYAVQQKSKKPTSSEPNLQNRKRQFHTPLHEGLEAGLDTKAILKSGMKVGLISPKSGKMVALGTIQKTDKNAISVDGQALNDCVDILVNTVFNQHTIIPRAYGMISKLGSAQARCIPWPRDNLMHPSGQALHSKVSTIARHNSANQGNSVALTEVFKHNSIDNALQSVVGHKRKVHDLTPKENIRREDTHSRAKKIGKARPDSPYANFTNSQLLTTSRF